MGIPPLDLSMFVIDHPGAETAVIGLGRYAAEGHLVHDADAVRPAPAAFTGGSHWQAFCKTQYASLSNNGGFDNFFTIHDGLCRVLDHAATLGLTVEVHDEGGYWQTRDVDALRHTVDHWNQLVAAVASSFKDALGSDDPDAVIAPITEDPAFEQMEARGRDLLDKRHGGASKA